MEQETIQFKAIERVGDVDYGNEKPGRSWLREAGPEVEERGNERRTGRTGGSGLTQLVSWQTHYGSPSRTAIVSLWLCHFPLGHHCTQPSSSDLSPGFIAISLWPNWGGEWENKCISRLTCHARLDPRFRLEEGGEAHRGRGTHHCRLA